jgi:peptide/nickel transport system substrate-binding protein
MDRATRRQIEEYRRRKAGLIENNLVDELVADQLDRHEFLRRAALYGLGAGTAGALLRYAGEADLALGTPSVAEAKPGGTLRIAVMRPETNIEPSSPRTVGAIGIVSIVVEYLTFSDAQGGLQPWLATGWKPNKDASVWTFQIRRGVKFHNGRALTADDVVASLGRALRQPASTSSVFHGVLEAEGVRKIGRHTVQLSLEAPVGAFPYLVSQATVQVPILPASYAAGTFIASRMPGTGPYKLESYTEGRSAIFVRNNAYWGLPPALDAVRVSMFESSAPQSLALRAGQIDLVHQLPAADAASLAGDARFKMHTAKTASHRQFSLRTDNEKFRDPRVRRAIALTLNRPGVTRALWRGRATLGNDSPFSPLYRSASRDVTQRVRSIRLARDLLGAAGAEGLSFTVTTWRGLELPDYARIIQSSARSAGIAVGVEILSGTEYYGAPPGHGYSSTAPWLNRDATITEYGHRAIPNSYLTGSFKTDGEWNASRYSSKAFDAALASYVSATDVATQRKYAKTMQALLLEDTPVIVAYFRDWIAIGSSKVRGYSAEAAGTIGLRRASLE